MQQNKKQKASGTLPASVELQSRSDRQSLFTQVCQDVAELVERVSQLF